MKRDPKKGDKIRRLTGPLRAELEISDLFVGELHHGLDRRMLLAVPSGHIVLEQISVNVCQQKKECPRWVFCRVTSWEA
jgi:hypothetical protein